MGRPKSILKWKDKTFLSLAANAAQKGGVNQTLVVLGPPSSAILIEVKTLNLRYVENPQRQAGMGTSIKIGLEFLVSHYPEMTGVLIQVVDQPAVTAATIGKFIEAHRIYPSKICAAQYNETLGVPTLFPKEFFSDLLSIPDDQGAKKTILRNLQNVISIPAPEAGMDIDTPEQFLNLKNLHHQ